MDTLADLTAAPETCEHAGQVYELSPLTLRDVAQHRQFVKGFIIDEAKDTERMMRERGAPEEHVKELWREARHAMQNPLKSQFADDISCVNFVVWLHLRHSHKDVTVEAVKGMLDCPETLDAVNAALRRLNSRREHAETAAKNS